MVHLVKAATNKRERPPDGQVTRAMLPETVLSATADTGNGRIRSLMAFLRAVRIGMQSAIAQNRLISGFRKRSERGKIPGVWA